VSSTAPPPSLAGRPSEPSATPHPGVAPLCATLSLAQRIDALLPQTQCTRCGYPDCRGYADAIATGAAELNQCPPGGAEGVRRLAALLGRPVLPLNPEFGDEGVRRVVYIEEATCIGCTLCIQACPVDAIIGAPKRMHAVIEADCTGCELCLPVCPVDCIALEEASAGATGWAAWSPAQAEAAQARYGRRQARLARDRREHDERLAANGAERLAVTATDTATDTAPNAKRDAVAAALARARLRAKARPQ
jgi:electron transport complex protein RnfB